MWEKKKEHKTRRKIRKQIVKIVHIKPYVSAKEQNTLIKCKKGKYWDEVKTYRAWTKYSI